MIRKFDFLARIPDDIKRFKELTSGNVIVMGRKTYESLPVRPLKDRINIVISNSVINSYGVEMPDGSFWMNFENAKSLLKWRSEYKNDKIFIIGGASIYRQFIDICDVLYLTKIYKEFENVDVFFPEFSTNDFILAKSSDSMIYDNISYKFLNYYHK